MIDINCDLGESYGHYRLGADEEMMRFITSANIACGFHAGDPLVMARTVALAVASNVGVGAHPSYPDLRGFGRHRIDLSPAEIESDLLYQIGALEAFARANGSRVSHVKAHGALYNVSEVDEKVAVAVARAVKRYNPDLVLVASATSALAIQAAEAEGLRVAREAFADRNYNPDGTLRSRREPEAVIKDAGLAAERAVKMARDGVIVAYDGTPIPVRPDTLCIHGDEPTAPAVAQAVRAALAAAGVEVKGLATLL
ncbi:MAG: 5-oxoprolinase subunit PxpA [Chloroflexi bacterium]|nr:5-oxoprolinase subunit PxpA [Chloroflexota bacterium]MCL5109908.1 5-oxoprolinase subunit PxpA [Chloroflexota bacterium]